jgi:hypothetical protein
VAATNRMRKAARRKYRHRPSQPRNTGCQRYERLDTRGRSYEYG